MKEIPLELATEGVPLRGTWNMDRFAAVFRVEVVFCDPPQLADKIQFSEPAKVTISRQDPTTGLPLAGEAIDAVVEKIEVERYKTHAAVCISVATVDDRLKLSRWIWEQESLLFSWVRTEAADLPQEGSDD